MAERHSRFLDPGLKELGAPTACVLGSLLLDPSHPATRKPKQPQGEAPVERNREPAPICQLPGQGATVGAEPLPQVSHWYHMEQKQAVSIKTCQNGRFLSKIHQYCCFKPLGFRVIHHAICNSHPKFAQNDPGQPPPWSSTRGDWPAVRGPVSAVRPWEDIWVVSGLRG